MNIKVGCINYNVEMKGEGAPLVCIHGFSENADTWKELEIEGYRLYLIDLIGHGKTDRPTNKKYYQLEYIIAHLHQVFKELNLNSFVLMGYSMGGRIALAYALNYPAEIRALILESASFGESKLRNRIKRRWSDRKLAKRIKVNGVLWFHNYWSELSIFDTQKRLPHEIQEEIKARRLANSPHALANTLITTGQGTFPCLKGRIMGLKLPILYLSGELDLKYQDMGKQFTELNDKIEDEVILAAGHNTHLENLPSFKNKVITFLRKIKELKR